MATPKWSDNSMRIEVDPQAIAFIKQKGGQVTVTPPSSGGG
ncbi:hypothetical protein DFAR_1690010 [Desulfarculales bacterium]